MRPPGGDASLHDTRPGVGASALGWRAVSPTIGLARRPGGAMEGNKATLIDTEADVEGRLKGKDAHILGRFRGEVEVSGRLLLGESSRVDAKIVADAAEIAGEFKGEIVARLVT